MSVRIYVEGGFQSSKNNCRRAFRVFFEKFLSPGTFQVIASGDRATAYKDFCLAVRKHESDYVLLLVDAEEEVTATDPWSHLKQRVGDEWECPKGAKADQVHLMVQVMETWLIADRKALAEYYGQAFSAGALPRHANLESVNKMSVYASLRDATYQTTKGAYHKTRHAFDLLERIDPALVRSACTHAERLFAVLERETN